jgi:hypothetical protein
MRQRRQPAPFSCWAAITGTIEANGGCDVRDPDPGSPWNDDRQATLSALVQRADRGDRTALPAVREVFDAVPGLWETYGDLATIAQNALIDLVAGKSGVTREGIRKTMAKMRADVSGPNASPLERLLVERVVACWALSYQADLAYADSLTRASPIESEHCQRRQDRAARQYLAALRSLAVVRRLLMPTVQVNVAERQVNIAGGEVHVGTRE